MVCSWAPQSYPGLGLIFCLILPRFLLGDQSKPAGWFGFSGRVYTTWDWLYFSSLFAEIQCRCNFGWGVVVRSSQEEEGKGGFWMWVFQIRSEPSAWEELGCQKSFFIFLMCVASSYFRWFDATKNWLVVEWRVLIEPEIVRIVWFNTTSTVPT